MHEEISKPTAEVSEMITFVEIDGVGVSLFKNNESIILTVSGSREYAKNIPLLQAHTTALKGRNATVKEYQDEGVMFVLKVEDGKAYEANMPIPKWGEVGKTELR